MNRFTNRLAPRFAIGVACGVVVSLAHADPPKPPPEAIAACSSAKEGDTCTVKFGEHTMDGTCVTTPDNVLACRPSGPPPGGGGGPPGGGAPPQ